jgi:hypothetical protein
MKRREQRLIQALRERGLHRQAQMLAETVEVRAFDAKLTVKTVDRFRAEFLMLMKNSVRVKNYDDAWEWRQAVKRWRDVFENYIDRVSKEMENLDGRKLTHPGIIESWQRDWNGGAWKIIHALLTLPPITSLDHARKYDPTDKSDESLKQELFEGFRSQVAAWDRKVKAKARESWEDLRTVVKSMDQSFQENDGLEVLLDEEVQIEGFYVKITDRSTRGYKPQETIETFKQALKIYAERAKNVYPWLLAHKIPFILTMGLSLDKSGEYDMGKRAIKIYPKQDNPRSVAKTIAHEMGHHLWYSLSGTARTFWEESVKGSKGPLDLREVPKHSKEEYAYLDEDLKKRDPIYALRLATLAHDPRFRGMDMATQSGIKEYLEKGNNPIVQVTVEPITGYAAKDPSEAFCEAFSLLVIYGQRAVLPVVRERVKMVLPQIKIISAKVQDTAKGKIASAATKPAEVRAFDAKLTVKTVDRFRSEFLMLMKNISVIKNYADAWEWRGGVLKWRGAFETYMEAVGKEVNRLPDISESLLKVWRADLRQGAWELVSAMYDVPVEPVDESRRFNSTAEQKEYLFEQYKKKVPKWERRVRDKARTSWTKLRSTIEALQSSLQGRNLPDLAIPVDEIVEMSGFRVTIRGYSERGYKVAEGVQVFKAALAIVADRAKKSYPWLLHHKIPFILDLNPQMSRGGEYDSYRKTITIYAHTYKPIELAKTIAHELGHHLYKTLDDKATAFWHAAVNGSRGPLDLRDIPNHTKENFFTVDDDLAEREPLYALRLHTLGDDPRFGGWDMVTQKGVQEYLAAGNDPIIQVTTEPITGYAAKNTTEAFCEAFSLALIYGPRTVLPQVRQRLQMLLPQMRIKASVTTKTRNS